MIIMSLLLLLLLLLSQVTRFCTVRGYSLGCSIYPILAWSWKYKYLFLYPTMGSALRSELPSARHLLSTSFVDVFSQILPTQARAFLAWCVLVFFSTFSPNLLRKMLVYREDLTWSLHSQEVTLYLLGPPDSVKSRFCQKQCSAVTK